MLTAPRQAIEGFCQAVAGGTCCCLLCLLLACSILFSLLVVEQALDVRRAGWIADLYALLGGLHT